VHICDTAQIHYPHVPHVKKRGRAEKTVNFGRPGTVIPAPPEGG